MLALNILLPPLLSTETTGMYHYRQLDPGVCINQYQSSTDPSKDFNATTACT